jgi:SNF2 family DNA or RNA helicase
MREQSAQEKEELAKTLDDPLEYYQIEAINFILANWERKINSLCALDVGMGKTRVACWLIYDLFRKDSPIKLQGYALICCSTEGTRDSIWKDTLTKYGIKIMTLEGEEFQRIKMERKKVLTIPPMTACLITYANLYRNIEYFQNSPPKLIVFDEYHILTDNYSKESHRYRQAVMRLPHCARLGLTATPFINNEMEAVVAVGLLNNTSLITQFYSSDADEKRNMVQKVKALKDNFLFYRKSQYNLTHASEWVISIPMSKELYCQYEKIRNKTIYAPMKRQHQIGKLTVSPSLVDKKLKLDLDNEIITGKIIALRSIVEHLPSGDKIVIVDTYRETLQYIARLDFIRPLKPVLYLGGKKTENKNSLELFLNKSDHRIFLTTRQEGGEGLNLQIANHLVLMNCWYTAKDIIQVFGRIKRKGQVKPVYTYLLGYNLFDCLGQGKCPEQYFLPEELDFYKAIREKTEMCEEWGIEVSTKLPRSRCFANSSTFEQEFNNFLNQVILPKQPMIESDEIKKDMEESKQEATGQSSMEMDTFWDTLLATLWLRYLNRQH